MTTTQEYLNLADRAYQVDRLKQDPPLGVGAEFTMGTGGNHAQMYRVIDTGDNSANGFQAMAVAPIINNTPDLTHVIIAYAGTNPAHRADLLEDIETIIGKTHSSHNQITDARAFAARIKATHPTATITTTGHSLGGFLALLTAAENNWDATTFNSPDPWDWLPPHTQHDLNTTEHSHLHNYVNEWDVIGNLYPDNTHAAIYVTDTPGRSLLDYHNIGKGEAFTFTADGDITGTGAKNHTLEEILTNIIDTLLPGSTHTLAPALLATTARNPTAMKTLAQGISGATIALDTIAALALAASINSLIPLLDEIKESNNRIIPRMHDALTRTQNAAALLPTITPYDIDNCITTHRLHVHHNVDENAINAVNETVTRHIQRVHQLTNGITQTIHDTLQQDKQWADTFINKTQ